jgi:heptosyltransferase-2
VTRLPDIERLVILAPNWLGDLVMAMPAMADVRRAFPQSRLFVAARRGVAGLLPFIPGLDGTIVFEPGGGLTAEMRALASERFDAALLLPNSFRAAWIAWRAKIAQRWGYRGDGRSPLLTEVMSRPAWPYRQVEYYQRLVQGLGLENGPAVPAFDVPGRVTDAARELLASHGHRAGDRLVVLAPGTANSTSKQWIPEYVASLIALLSRDAVRCALVGAQGDAGVGRRILSSAPEPVRARVIDLIGKTTVEELVGVLTIADVVVGNDSGAMHLAAGLGTRVVATFGPTNELHSPPLAHPHRPAIVVTNEVWCRPCMLMKECPIDHSCMTGIAPERVHDAVRSLL